MRMQRCVSTATKSILSEFTLDSGLCGRQKLKQVKQVDLGHAAVNSILASEAPVCFRAICQRGLVALSPTRCTRAHIRQTGSVSRARCWRRSSFMVRTWRKACSGSVTLTVGSGPSSSQTPVLFAHCCLEICCTSSRPV